MILDFQRQIPICTHKNPLSHFVIHTNPNTNVIVLARLNQRRYKILCIQLIKDQPKPEIASQIILTHLQMPDENYRMGKTKVHCDIVVV